MSEYRELSRNYILRGVNGECKGPEGPVYFLITIVSGSVGRRVERLIKGRLAGLDHVAKGTYNRLSVGI